MKTLTDDGSLQYYITRTCIDARERAGVRATRIADLAGRGERSVQRFEMGATFPTDHLEAYLAAYARVAPDAWTAADLLMQAVADWSAYGVVPMPEERS